jgi:transcriptional regulator with XRE-family HTH domain
MYKYISSFLRQAREGKNLTQVELAKKTGLSESQIYKYERGVSGIPLYSLAKLSEELDFSIDAMLKRK